MIDLEPGDLVYYSPNLALGLLINRFIDEDGQPVWNYILRSPRRSDLEHHLVSTRQVGEDQIIAAIDNGRFVLHKAKGG
jgi:hypothetical protein